MFANPISCACPRRLQPVAQVWLRACVLGVYSASIASEDKGTLILYCPPSPFEAPSGAAALAPFAPPAPVTPGAPSPGQRRAAPLGTGSVPGPWGGGTARAWKSPRSLPTSIFLGEKGRKRDSRCYRECVSPAGTHGFTGARLVVTSQWGTRCPPRRGLI